MDVNTAVAKRYVPLVRHEALRSARLPASVFNILPQRGRHRVIKCGRPMRRFCKRNGIYHLRAQRIRGAPCR